MIASSRKSTEITDELKLKELPDVLKKKCVVKHQKKKRAPGFVFSFDVYSRVKVTNKPRVVRDSRHVFKTTQRLKISNVSLNAS